MNIRKIVLQVTALFTAAGAQAQNPIIQTIYTADPAPMVYKDTVYLYTGHDEDKSTCVYDERLALLYHLPIW